MGYLIVEMMVLLLIAAAIGFIIGWFLRRGGRAVEDIQTEHAELLAAAEKRTADLNKEIQEDQSEIEKLRAQLDNTRREVDGERGRSADLEGEMGTIREKEAALAAAKSNVESRDSEISSLRDELKEARAAGVGTDQTAALQANIDRLTIDLDNARLDHADCDAAKASLNTRITGLEARLAAAPSDAASTDGAAAASAGSPSAGSPSAPSAGSPGAGTGGTDKPRPTWLLDKPDGDIDDLKRIKGVGPVMEKTLNGLGIYHFRQVAKLDADGIEWVSDNIETFPGRITRDGWVEQANELHKEKYGSLLSGLDS